MTCNLWLIRFANSFLICLVYSASLYAENYDGSLIGAVRITLERQYSIAISKQQVLLGEAAVLSAQSVFDQMLNAGASVQHTNTPMSSIYSVSGFIPPYSPISELTADVTSYTAGLTQKLRSGITVNPALTVTHTLDNYMNFASPSNANVALNFTLPLQKGQGEEVTTANERSALLSRDAALQNQKYAVSTAITATVAAYWNYLAAKQALDIARSTEERAQNLLNDSRKLAAGDEIPRSDIRRYESKLLNETGIRIGAEQSLVLARNSLGLAMGFRGSEIAIIPAPIDSFQMIDDTGLDAISIQTLSTELAAAVQNRRADILALESSMRATEALLVAADNSIKPQLDLIVSVGYNGMLDRRPGATTPLALDALGSNVRGGNASVGLNYLFPVNNHAAQGQILQQTATLEQIRLQKEALMSNIQSSIEVSLNSLRNAADQLKHVKAEVKIQQEVYDNEKKKYRVGMATLLDLFINLDQLTIDQSNEVNARLNLAQALIQVRFQTGTLLNPDIENQTLDYSRLVTVPYLAAIKEHSR